MRAIEVREGEGGRRPARLRVGLAILGVIALALSAIGCDNAPIPDVQVTPNYVGVVQRVVGSDPTGSTLQMTDGTTKTIDLKVQRAVYRLPSVGPGDLLLLSTTPGSLGAAALVPCPGESGCWFMRGGGKDDPDGYVLTQYGIRLKKSASFSSWVTDGTYPSNGSLSVDRQGEVTGYG
jgi:hypothetical protein